MMIITTMMRNTIATNDDTLMTITAEEVEGIRMIRIVDLLHGVGVQIDTPMKRKSIDGGGTTMKATMMMDTTAVTAESRAGGTSLVGGTGGMWKEKVIDVKLSMIDLAVDTLLNVAGSIPVGPTVMTLMRRMIELALTIQAASLQ